MLRLSGEKNWLGRKKKFIKRHRQYCYSPDRSVTLVGLAGGVQSTYVHGVAVLQTYIPKLSTERSPFDLELCIRFRIPKGHGGVVASVLRQPW